MRKCMRPDRKIRLRILCLILTAVMCVGTASCAAEKKEGRVVKIALLSGQTSTEASSAFAGEFEALMESYSDDDIIYDVTVMQAAASSSKQSAQADMCCLQDFDILVIESADPSKGDDLLARCVRSVALEEAEKEDAQESGEEGADLSGIYDVYEKSIENGSFSDERINAEARTYPGGVYAPPTVPENVPVIFAGIIPSITPREVPETVPEEDYDDEDDWDDDDEEEEQQEEQPSAEEPSEPEHVWCIAAYDHLAAAELLAQDIIEKRLLYDVNGDGRVAYAFAATDATNPVNQAMVNVIKAKMAEAYPDSVQAFSCFMALSEDAYVERLIYYMTGTTPADLIIALDDAAIDYTDTFSLVCGYEEDEEKRHEETYDLGTELMLAGIGYTDLSRVMFEEEKLSSLVLFDPAALAQAVAERCLAVIAGEPLTDTVLECETAQMSEEE